MVRGKHKIKYYCRLVKCDWMLRPPSSAIASLVIVAVVGIALALFWSIWVGLRSTHGVRVVLGPCRMVIGTSTHVFLVIITPRVLSNGNQILATVAWHHLQVGVAVPAVGGCCSWDSRHAIGSDGLNWSWPATCKTIESLRRLGSRRVWIGLLIIHVLGLLVGFLLGNYSHNRQKDECDEQQGPEHRANDYQV